ncbi:MAG: hypothetical protein ACRETW_15195 [Stenotrophobium sp.]
MNPLHLLLAINLLLTIAAFAWAFRLQAKLRRLESGAAALLVELGAQPADLKKELADKKAMLLTVEILNPMELARKESWFAGAAGSLAPGLVRRIVYRRTRAMMLDQLALFHVKAEVRQHVGG